MSHSPLCGKAADGGNQWITSDEKPSNRSPRAAAVEWLQCAHPTHPHKTRSGCAMQHLYGRTKTQHVRSGSLILHRTASTYKGRLPCLSKVSCVRAASARSSNWESRTATRNWNWNWKKEIFKLSCVWVQAENIYLKNIWIQAPGFTSSKTKLPMCEPKKASENRANMPAN